MIWTFSAARLTEATDLVRETLREIGTGDKSGNVRDETAKRGHK